MYHLHCDIIYCTCWILCVCVIKVAGVWHGHSMHRLCVCVVMYLTDVCITICLPLP